MSRVIVIRALLPVHPEQIVMDLVGLPWQVVVGPRGLAAGTVELKRRASGERMELAPDAAIARLVEACTSRTTT